MRSGGVSCGRPDPARRIEGVRFAPLPPVRLMGLVPARYQGGYLDYLRSKFQKVVKSLATEVQKIWIPAIANSGVVLQQTLDLGHYLRCFSSLDCVHLLVRAPGREKHPG